jgi:hypothetical protein
MMRVKGRERERESDVLTVELTIVIDGVRDPARCCKISPFNELTFDFESTKETRVHILFNGFRKS